jgi:hypothetical protein
VLTVGIKLNSCWASIRCAPRSPQLGGGGLWSDMRCAVDDAKRKQEAAEESVAWYAERTNVAWQETSRVMAERDALMLEHRRLCAQQPHVGTGVMWIAE